MKTSLLTIADESISNLSPGSLVEAYLASTDVSPASKKIYRQALRRYEAWCADEGLDLLEVKGSDLVAYKQSLLDSGLKPRTVNLYIAALKGFYQALEDQRVIPNPARRLRSVATGTSPKRSLTPDEAKALLSLEPNTPQQARDLAMVSLMCRRGLRSCEIVRANLGDLQTVAGTPVLFVWGKGHTSADEAVVLGGVAKDIEAWLAVRGPGEAEDPLFCSLGPRNHGGRLTTKTVARAATSAMEAAGIEMTQASAHSLRHTAVTLALMGGASPQEVQRLARHRSLDTTMGYAHNIQRLEGVPEAAIDRLLEAN